jgi:uncharacterized membrane protein
MKTALSLGMPLALLLLTGCAANQAPYSAVRDASYAALGENPFWMVAIGDDKIVLTLGPAPGTEPGKLDSHIYPRVLPRTAGEVKRWESGEGTDVITVEARPGPCTTGGRAFEDNVKVALSGRMFEGCGGRQYSGGRG